MVHQVGYRSVEVVDASRGLTIAMLVMYPTEAREAVERIGPFTLSVATNAPPREGRYPLVIVSHGTGGSHVSHRELARDLASRGFLVGVPEHPRNNRRDDSLAGSVELLAERPKDIRAVVDWFFADPTFSPCVEGARFSLVGHSLGGYTGLAVAGGEPTSLPHQSADRIAKRIDVSPDDRLEALVLLAPATVWFRLPGALAKVDLPILMIASYHDMQAPYFYMCQIVLDGVADASKVDYRLVEDASHYAFLSPWPDALKSPALAPSQDPPGFDRPRFLEGIYRDIASFLSRRDGA